MTPQTTIAVIGAGAMGSGIAQVAAVAGHPVVLFDAHEAAIHKAQSSLKTTLQKLQEKGKLANAGEVFSRFHFASSLEDLKDCGLVIEAIIEDLDVKKKVFAEVETHVSQGTVLATNTSSLSVTSIAAACTHPQRVLGLHFFNPAPLMALVEIIPAIQTSAPLLQETKHLVEGWGKTLVEAKDTPGFIVNRVARPYYGEAIRIYEEGIADIPTIDWALKEMGGFRMGPFELTDYIGHDVNYVVTETVWKSFFYDGRYKPSFSQKRLLEAGWLGRKSGRGFYDYSESAEKPVPTKDEAIGKGIVERVVAMLINEAADALHYGVATPEDLETAMTKGVNYPKGLLQWATDLGTDRVLSILDSLYELYHEERYRASMTLRMAVARGRKLAEQAVRN